VVLRAQGCATWQIRISIAGAAATLFDDAAGAAAV